MTLDEYEKIVPNAKVDGITFLTPNSHCAWRVQTLYTKEPDTIEWLHKMKPGETLFDVGANMGQYSLLPAQRGIRVHAFEPESQNFALLVKNVIVNNLSDLVTAWPLALSNQLSVDILHLSSLIAGGSCHAFGKSIDYRGNERQFPYSQGSVAWTMDAFASKFGYPDHIKIDVDGFEHLVVEGGADSVRSAKSVLIEINTRYPEHTELLDIMTNRYGFNYDAAQAESARRKEGPFEGVGNVIFYKD